MTWRAISSRLWIRRVKEVSALPSSADAADYAPQSATQSSDGRSRSALAAFSWITLIARSVIMMAAGFVMTPYLLRFLGAEWLGGFCTWPTAASVLTLLVFGLRP